MVDIMAIGAHPDDVEFGCGGLLCKEAGRGASIVIVDMTLGQKGTHGTARERKEEALLAARLIGAKRVFLDFVDCEVQDTYEGRMQLVRVIREHKPRLVLAQNAASALQHPDHIAAATLARSAARYARFKNVLPDLPVHSIEGILHYPGPMCQHVDLLIDVSDYIKQWKEMILCHKSQHLTYNYLDRSLRTAAFFGAMMDVSYAQGLVCLNPLIVEDALSVAKGTKEL